MIGYITLGTDDLEKSAKFYDVLLAKLGAKRSIDMEGLIVWSASPSQSALALRKPFDGNPPTVGNGLMVALTADSRIKVDDVYKTAIELGAIDEGKPGLRGDKDNNFYAAYFRDPNGHKLNVFYIGQ